MLRRQRRSGKPDAEQTWANFKEYWKKEIHQWEAAGKSKKHHANQATDIETLAKTVNALKAETRNLQVDNSTLAEELKFQRAYNAEQSRKTDDTSTISELTVAIQGLEC